MAQATETKLKFSLQIYDENTIEVGVYIDRHLYKVMEEAIKSKDATEVKDALLKMVHELMTAVGIISLSRILLLLGIALIKLFCRVARKVENVVEHAS